MSGAGTLTFKEFDFAEIVVLALSAITTAIFLIWLLWLCTFGFDFTDEGLYLVWMANPFQYHFSVTQFGFFYHPLYKLFAGNIATLRQANVLFNFALSWMLADIILQKLFAVKSNQRISRTIISAAFATASATALVFSGAWLSTPSYNSLALQSLLITALGMLMAGKSSNLKSATGWLLIGLGTALACLAKPPTALVLLVLIAIYMLSASKMNIKLVALSAIFATSLVLFFALAVDGSVFTFSDRLLGGLEVASLLQSGHTSIGLFRIDRFHMGQYGIFFLTLVALAFFLASYSFYTRKIFLQQVGLLICIAIFAACLAIISGLYFPLPVPAEFRGLLILAIPLAAVVLGVVSCRFQGLLLMPQANWALAATLMLLPYAYAFGTTNNYWMVFTNASIFWVLGGLVFIGATAPSKSLTMLIPVGLGVQLLSIFLIQSGIQLPYRQPQPLTSNDFKIDIGRPGSSLSVSGDFGRYISEANDVAFKSGLKQGQPVIDLTGRSPGLLYAIGASNIGQAWTLGGYPGSEKLASAMLKKAACTELSVSWLLVEPDGLGRISAAILSSYGANIESDFERVGGFYTPLGAGGHKESKRQELLKPTRPFEEAVTACRQAMTNKV